jgi:hypothetical protein
MTQFFNESGVLDARLLESIGVEDTTNRMLLVGYFDSMFRYTRPDINSAYLEFVHRLHALVLELDTGRRSIGECHNRIEFLENSVSRHVRAAEEVQSRMQILETRASDLSVVNEQLKEAITAHKKMRDEYKRELSGKDSVITSLRADMEAYDARLSKCLEDASVVDSSLKVQLTNLKTANSRYRQLLLHRDRVFKRRMLSLVKEAADIRQKWARWAKNNCVVHGRCGCKASIRYFQRTNIDIEWLTAQAEIASAGFRNELEEATNAMRAQIQAVRLERDDALADCGVYIDRVLNANEELQRVNLAYAALLGELSSAKMALAKRADVERAVIRLRIFPGGGDDGALVVCPVPTMDGILLPLAEVYRGWMSGPGGGGDGMESKFVCPVTGESNFTCVVRLLSVMLLWWSRCYHYVGPTEACGAGVPGCVHGGCERVAPLQGSVF